MRASRLAELAAILLGLAFVSLSGCSKSSEAAEAVICEGDVLITSAEEYAAFVERGCTSVTGSLSITRADLTSVSLPTLIEAGSLDISENASLESVDLPSLVNVPEPRECGDFMVGTCQGGLNISNNTHLTSLNLPVLTRLDSGEISHNPALGSLILPSLETIQNDSRCYVVSDMGGVCYAGLRLDENTSLTVLSLPALRTGGIGVGDNTVLTTINLPVFTNGLAGVYDGQPALMGFALPLFRKGSVEVSAEAVSDLGLPSLTTGSVSIITSALTSLSLPSLVTGSVYLERTVLTDVSLPALMEGSVGLNENRALPSLSLPALMTGSVGMGGGHDAFTTLRLPVLYQASDLGSEGNPALTSIDAPALRTVGQLHVVSNGMSSLMLPALRNADHIAIAWNANLMVLKLPELVSITSVLDISNNPHLPQCWVQAVLAQLEVVPGWIGIGGNDPTGTCSP